MSITNKFLLKGQSGRTLARPGCQEASTPTQSHKIERAKQIQCKSSDEREKLQSSDYDQFN